MAGWASLIAGSATSARACSARIDVVEDSNALSITAELPGMDRGDVEILAEDDALILRGERGSKPRARKGLLPGSKRAFGNFLRVIRCPRAPTFSVRRRSSQVAQIHPGRRQCHGI